MDTIITFLADNYIWFLVVTLILIFALIGYLVDTKKDERFTQSISLDDEVMNRVKVAETVNLTLNDMVSDKTETVNENEENLYEWDFFVFLNFF